MKRCPQCGREYDNTMMFCLDDGMELLYGPASENEPSTAILHSRAAPGEAPTRAQIQMTDQTAVLPLGTGDIAAKSRGFDKRILFAPLILAVIVLGGFFGYRYVVQAKQIESIAVMPFVNESGNPDVEYLSDGMTETLIRSLSGIQDMDVKPRSAVFRYKGKDTDIPTIGKELNVQAVLSGRVTVSNDQLVLSLEMVDVQKNRIIWTEQYNRRQSDVVSLQGEIAKDVSSKLLPRISGEDESKVSKQATADPVAYQAYLRGRYYWNKRTGDDMYKAIEQFQTAIDRDPNYTIAYSGLADCYALLPDWAENAPVDSRARAIAFAKKAIELDPQLAEPHATMGQLYFSNWQWAEAEREYKRAIELNQNYATAYHWYSVLLYSLDRNEEAAAMITRAYQIDPLSGIISQNYAQMLRLKNDINGAIEVSKKIIDLDPNFPGGHFTLGWQYLKIGRYEEAIDEFKKSLELSGRHSYAISDLSAAYAYAGRKNEALELLRELQERYKAKKAEGSDIASVYTALGDKDKAFEWLFKDLETNEQTVRSGRLASIRRTPQFEPLRDEPRFKEILKRMGLPE